MTQKVAIITSGTRGIGAAIAQAFQEAKDGLAVSLFFILFSCLFFTSALAADSRSLQQDSLSPQTYKRVVEETDFRQRTLTPDDFLIEMKKGAIILDLRAESAFNREHVQGAFYLGSDVREDKVGALVPNKQKKILIYCTNSLTPKEAMVMSRMISLTVVDLPQFEALGYKNVYRLEDYPSQKGLDKIPMVKGKLFQHENKKGDSQ